MTASLPNGNLAQLVGQHLAAASTGWSIGVPGALAEFHRDECAMNGRSVITEVGPDRDAIRPQDRDAILFDLGLGTRYCDFHVRTADPYCISRLRQGLGSSLFDAGHGMTLYPANPVLDGHGVRKPFDAGQHAAFQSVLTDFGDADGVEIKRAVWRSVREGAPPHSLGNLAARRHRIACRIALRQMMHCDGSSPLLSQWRSTFDPPARRAMGARGN